MKKVWRIRHNPQLLLSKIYQPSHLPSGQHLFRRRQPSWGHRGLLLAEALLNDNCHWKVGNGHMLGVTSHKWIPEHQPLFKDTTPLATVRQLQVQHLLLPDNQGWNIRRINSLFEPMTARRIKGIELPHCPTTNDIQFWPYTKSGTYTTKSGYTTLLQQKNETHSMTSPMDATFSCILWSLNIMPKWKLFLWKLWHNGLTTTSNLHHRGITMSGECPICLYESEDTQHLFQQCPLAIEAWEHGPLQTLITPTRQMSTQAWLHYCLLRIQSADGATNSAVVTFIGTLWAIWKLRNAQVFRQQRPTSESIAFSGARRHASTCHFCATTA